MNAIDYIPVKRLEEAPTGSVAQLAAELYPGQVYDFALPQGWVAAMQAIGFDPRGQCVWLYPHGFVYGFAAPLTRLAYEAIYLGRKTT